MVGREVEWMPVGAGAWLGQRAPSGDSDEHLRRENEELRRALDHAERQAAEAEGEQQRLRAMLGRAAEADQGAPTRTANLSPGHQEPTESAPACGHAVEGFCERANSLDAIFQGAAIGITLTDTEGHLLEANPALAAMLGYTPDELRSLTYVDLTHPDDVQESVVRFRELLDGKRTSYQFQKRYLRRDGSVVWTRATVSLVQRGEGATVAVAMIEDITAQKEAEDSLRESERRYRSLFRNNHAVMLLIDPATGQIVDANPAACAFYGHPIDQITRLKITDINTLTPEQVFEEMERARSEQRKHFLFRHRLASGEVRDVEVYSGPIEVEGRDLLYSLVHDITERVRAEAALRQTKERLQAIFDASPLPVFALDTDANVTGWNRAAEGVFGWRAAEVLGRPYPGVPPESRAHFEESWARLLRGEALSGWESVRVRKDGTRIDVSISAAPLHDDQGRVVGTMAVLADITERKRQQAEREQLLARERSALAEAQEANRARDRFIAVLSHELRTPLTPILAGVHLLRQHADQDPRACRTLEIMERNVELQARLVDDLLDVARVAQGRLRLERHPIRLDAVVREAVEAHQVAAAEGAIRLIAELEGGLWVDGDPDRLQQVVGNLIVNALKFVTDEGEVRVALRRDGGEARIVVEDNGIGIEPSVLPRLFGLFEQGEVGGQRATGLGIGLSLVRSLAEAHGGRAWAESEGLGKGSRFTVALPLIAPPQQRATDEPQSGEQRYAKLLLVEDHEDTRVLLAATLELVGYEVQEAGSAEEALELLGRFRPDAIISDVGLPGLDGCEFIERVRTMPGFSETPAFAVTGWGQAEDVRRALDAGFTGHSTKPVDAKALDRVLRKALGR